MDRIDKIYTKNSVLLDRQVQGPFTDYPGRDEFENRAEGDPHPGITLHRQQLLDGIKIVFFLVDECPEFIELAFLPCRLRKK